ncbi:hypothetical protein CRYUN_Cryun40dG0056600 [Craigia yunnanensis]
MNIDSIGAEVLNAAQAVIDAVIRLCNEYSQVINYEFSGAELENNENGMDCEQACITNHIMYVTTVTVEKLFELGILAANDGGSLVAILNVSWKGLVTLLQLAKGKLPVKVKVADIIVSLISLVNSFLKCAAEVWSSSLKETVSVTEANVVNENPVSKCRMTSMDEIFSVSCEAMPRSRVLLLGQVALFSGFLRYSFDLEEDVKLLIARKLVVSSTLAWEELGSFLVKNFLHPHFLCSEIIMELWCFLVRHAEMELVNVIIVEICALMKLVASPESIFVPDSNLRKMARSVCILLSFSTTSVVDCVYSSVVGDGRSQLSSVLYAALLLEGFPLNLLSQNTKTIAKEKIISDYFGFIDSFDDRYEFGVPVFALSASLQSLQVTISDIDMMKTLKFLVAIVCGYRNSVDKLKKKVCCKLLSQTLEIISNLSHRYASEEMEVILELHKLFVSGPAASDTLLHQCKPVLRLFLAGLSNMGMLESDNCAKSSAVWELYHTLLRERHWAFVHLSIAAFGYFAARTNCNQLWRFVPQDAALSYDLVSGKDANEVIFMSEFKAFLEKEMALPAVIAISEQLGLLLEEGLVLKEKAGKVSIIKTDAARCDSMEIDDEYQSNKRRKLPDGINKGVELLQEA